MPKETEKKERTFDDLNAAEKLRLGIRYKAWFDSCMKGQPFMAPMFTSVAMISIDLVNKFPAETDEDIERIELYNIWCAACLEGKPIMEKEYTDAAIEFRNILIAPDGRMTKPAEG